MNMYMHVRSEFDHIDSVLVLGGVVLGRDHKPLPLPGPLVDHLTDVNKLLFFVEQEGDLIVVAGAGVNHHVLVAEEEHRRAWIIQLVHLGIRNPLYHTSPLRRSLTISPLHILFVQPYHTP